MIGALNAVWGAITGGVSAVVGAAKEAVEAVFRFAAGVFDLVSGAWDWMVNGIGWLGDNLIGALARLLHLAEWILGTVIPHAFSTAFNDAVRWATGAIHTAGNALKHAFTTALHVAEGAINTVLHGLGQAFSWAKHQIVGAVNWIENAGKRVADLVLHPDKIVRWILAALILPLVRFFIEQSAWLVLWLLKAFTRESAAFGAMLESVLVKLL
jgi:phage-related protein